MTIDDIEAEALKLSASERIRLAARLLASVKDASTVMEDDPIRELGMNPVDTGDTDASVAHDRYLYNQS